MTRTITMFILVSLSHGSVAFSRQWTDASGKYKLDAELVNVMATSVVLKKSDQSLIRVDIDRLSDEDRVFLDRQKVSINTQGRDQIQTWILKNGIRVRGSFVEYGESTMSIQRQRGKVCVNDKPLETLPLVGQQLVPHIVSHFMRTSIDGEKGLQEWARQQKGEARRFQFAGILVELVDGEFCWVPAFLMSAKDLRAIEPSRREWQKEKKVETRKQTASRIQGRAVARQKAKANSRVKSQRLAQANLRLNAVRVGVTDLWEVTMSAGSNGNGRTIRPLVSGRNSSQASAKALANHPGYRIVSVAKVR